MKKQRGKRSGEFKPLARGNQRGETVEVEKTTFDEQLDRIEAEHTGATSAFDPAVITECEIHLEKIIREKSLTTTELLSRAALGKKQSFALLALTMADEMHTKGTIRPAGETGIEDALEEAQRSESDAPVLEGDEGEDEDSLTEVRPDDIPGSESDGSLTPNLDYSGSGTLPPVQCTQNLGYESTQRMWSSSASSAGGVQVSMEKARSMYLHQTPYLDARSQGAIPKHRLIQPLERPEPYSTPRDPRITGYSSMARSPSPSYATGYESSSSLPPLVEDREEDETQEPVVVGKDEFQEAMAQAMKTRDMYSFNRRVMRGVWATCEEVGLNLPDSCPDQVEYLNTVPMPSKIIQDIVLTSVATLNTKVTWLGDVVANMAETVSEQTKTISDVATSVSHLLQSMNSQEGRDQSIFDLLGKILGQLTVGRADHSRSKPEEKVQQRVTKVPQKVPEKPTRYVAPDSSDEEDDPFSNSLARAKHIAISAASNLPKRSQRHGFDMYETTAYKPAAQKTSEQAGRDDSALLGLSQKTVAFNKVTKPLKGSDRTDGSSAIKKNTARSLADSLQQTTEVSRKPTNKVASVTVLKTTGPNNEPPVNRYLERVVRSSTMKSDHMMSQTGPEGVAEVISLMALPDIFPYISAICVAYSKSSSAGRLEASDLSGQVTDLLDDKLSGGSNGDSKLRKLIGYYMTPPGFQVLMKLWSDVVGRQSE